MATDLLDGVFPDEDPQARPAEVKATVEERRQLLREWSRDPWDFLTGRDTDGRAIVWTKDEGDSEHPYKAFPSKEHLFRLTRDLFRDDEKVVLVDKSRQMMVSTLCCLLILWLILFRRGRVCFISKQKRELAEMLMRDKIAGPYERLPGWVRDALPLDIAKSQIVATRTDSRVNAVAQNAAVGEFRGNRASIVLVDEAAFQEFFPQMVGAAREMCDRMWAVTTANSGNPGARKFLALAREE
jgi:hypothetical protein